MTALDLFSLRFALACCACLAAGMGVWAATALCRRSLPALALQRSTWLLGQLVIAATCVLVLLPQSARLRMVPEIELAHVAPAASVATPAPASAAAPDAAQDGQAWTVYAARAWLLVYLLGLAVSAARLWQAQRAVDRLAASGTRIAAHAGFTDGRAPLPVIEVAAAMSPMLIRPWSPRLLLPRHLRSFDPVQQQLIVAHELMHWRRGDLHWMTVSLVLHTLFWFHPAMRPLRTRLSWAQELACDRAVLSGRTAVERRAYAAALVAQLGWQHRALGMGTGLGLAFGGVGATTLADRIALIRTPLVAKDRWWTRAIPVVAVSAIFAGNLALQPALAWPGGSSAALDCTLMIDAASGAPLLQQGACDQRVTPASTFNIAVSLMGFDSGFLKDAHTPRLPFKAGYVDWNDDWRQATDPAAWITNSTVWYAQQVTTHLGAPRLAQYLARFDYGNRDMAGDAGKDNGLQSSWIGSSMQISPREQAAFLRRIVNRQLPVTPHALDVTAQLLALPFKTGGWQVYGKTGTANSVDDVTQTVGWFVGWATKGSRTVVFARLLRDKSQADSFAGPRVKAAFLRDLPARLAAL